MINSYRRTGHKTVTSSQIQRPGQLIAITLAASCFFLAASMPLSYAGALGRIGVVMGVPVSRGSEQPSSPQFSTKELSLPGANGLVTLDYSRGIGRREGFGSQPATWPASS
ncbi:MAG TPA: hypothetical protein VNS63_14880 [Blastocatellia bacterium]|nr:hypothetical protein [Blastocatellia bacterium]